MQKPTKPCYACGGTDWWQRPDGGWNCSKCCPNPNPGKTGIALEVIALLDRVRKGNDKLWNAWKVIRDIENPEEKEELFRKWHEKKELLELLCKELVTRGFRDCLYIENGKKTKGCLYNQDNPEWFCNTCPAAKGGGPKYWVQEMGFKE